MSANVVVWSKGGEAPIPGPPEMFEPGTLCFVDSHERKSSMFARIATATLLSRRWPVISVDMSYFGLIGWLVEARH